MDPASPERSDPVKQWPRDGLPQLGLGESECIPSTCDIRLRYYLPQFSTQLSMTSKSSTNLPQPDWESVLDRYMAPNYPNVFVLGCFATHLTLYSQQVRALNLVAA